MKKTIISLVTSAVCLFLMLTSEAQSADPTPKEIAEKALGKQAWQTMTSDMTMILIDKKKSQRIRKLKTFAQYSGKDKKAALYFVSPADVKNSAAVFMFNADNNKSNESFLYLSGIGKTKKIPATGQADRFMGSDFTYADLTGLNPADWSYKFAKKKSTIIDNVPVWLIDAHPLPDRKAQVIKETGYVMITYWVRKDISMIVKGNYKVKKGKKIKYLSIKDISQINGIWTPHKMEMTTKKRGRIEHSTLMVIGNVNYNSPIPEERFNTNRLAAGL